jgi:hypothetical protein
MDSVTTNEAPEIKAAFSGLLARHPPAPKFDPGGFPSLRDDQHAPDHLAAQAILQHGAN